MVGNDVVDLDDPETDAEGLNQRFDERVFTTDERRRLATSGDAHTLRWTLWAAKESAYKLVKRFDAATVFAHSMFDTDLDDRGRGTVRYGEWCCAVALSREGPAIHAIATAARGDCKRIVSGLDRVPVGGDPSVWVRKWAIRSVASHLCVDPVAITITAGVDRIPVLRVGGRPLGHLSLSHHGALAAFAWMPPQE